MEIIRIPAFIAACAMTAYAMGCAAEEQPAGLAFHVAPRVGFVRADDDRRVDDGTAFSFAAGFATDPRWRFELDYFRSRLDGASGDDLTLDALGIDVLRVFRAGRRAAPFVLAGVGAQRNDRAIAGSTTDAFGELGAGLLATLRSDARDGRALSLRLDARARYEAADDGRLDYLVGVGLQYAFGRRVSHQAATPAAGPAASAPADDDRDGVPDDRDRCLGTPTGTAVGADGCELDTDRDGVADSDDGCPQTAAGARVDARGCTPESALELPLVMFGFDSDRLGVQAIATLTRVVDMLGDHPDVRVEVIGHTDDRGPDAYNLALSQRRAEAVRRYLIERGVKNELTARGAGEREPVADNRTADGRAQNRRVVLRTAAL